ncbi:MAG: hypothetical protein Q8L79_04165 [Methylobacter sp.]|uniref:hypothetical protein n=1 Tax=Methylobacter sp. TaxID=2051955 RepID=UPI002731DD84|nr:hypothetical protein [Methylobacter sp.]MDP1664300.1 hypothetical protein [Methylobacter sp.]
MKAIERLGNDNLEINGAKPCLTRLHITVAHFQLDGRLHSVSGSVSSGTQVKVGIQRHREKKLHRLEQALVKIVSQSEKNLKW